MEEFGMDNWKLINIETVNAIRTELELHDTESARHTLMLLDSGVHECNVKPWDM